MGQYGQGIRFVNILWTYHPPTWFRHGGKEMDRLEVSRGELVQMLSLDPANIKVSSMKMFLFLHLRNDFEKWVHICCGNPKAAVF